MRISDWSSDVCSSDLLDGKIRVSVVATGIDADAALQPPAQDSARVFSFSTPKKAVQAPAPDTVADAPAAEAIDAPVEEPPIAAETPIAAEAAAGEPARDDDAEPGGDPLSKTGGR